jgi:hypothetical protein
MWNSRQFRNKSRNIWREKLMSLQWTVRSITYGTRLKEITIILEKREYGNGDPLHWPQETLYLLKLALTYLLSAKVGTNLPSIHFFFYHPRSNLVKDENGDLFADSHNILNSWKNYFKLFSVHSVNYVRQKYVQLRLSDQWKESIIIPFYKKGNKTDCSNYYGISLLSALYKILWNSLSRLSPYIDKIIGNHQCGFWCDSPSTGEKNGSAVRQYTSYS